MLSAFSLLYETDRISEYVHSDLLCILSAFDKCEYVVCVLYDARVCIMHEFEKNIVASNIENGRASQFACECIECMLHTNTDAANKQTRTHSQIYTHLMCERDVTHTERMPDIRVGWDACFYDHHIIRL